MLLIQAAIQLSSLCAGMMKESMLTGGYMLRDCVESEGVRDELTYSGVRVAGFITLRRWK